MIYVGIDVASTKHDCCLLHDETGMVYSKPFTIKNNLDGFKKLHKAITDFVEKTSDNKVRIGLESTGPYHSNILNYLKDLNYEITLLNPLLTNMDKKATSVRKTKTDTIDCIAICNYLMRNRNDFRPYTGISYHIEGLKSISRLRFRTVKELSSQKQILNRLLTICFPEIISLFSKIDTDSLLDLLENYPTPDLLLNTSNDNITNLLHWKCKTSAEELKQIASCSIGHYSQYDAFQIQMTISQIKFLKDSVQKYDKEIKKMIKNFNSNLLSMPGIGFTTAAIIISEIGDINRFSNADKLLAYCGLDIVVYQSGNFEKSNRQSKRGSSILRWAIHQIAFIIYQHDKTFNDYYLKKISEGKCHNVVISHIEKKIVRVLYTLMKNNSSYIPQK